MRKRESSNQHHSGGVRQESRRIILLCFSGVFAALTFVLTSFTHIRLGSSIGYVHIGDAAIFLAASLLPAPYAMASAAIGASLADWFLGSPVWIIATAPIKALTALCFTAKKQTLFCVRNSIAIAAAALIGSGGYYLYESLLYSNFVAPAAFIVPNILQSLVSGGAYILMAVVLDRVAHVKAYFSI